MDFVKLQRFAELTERSKAIDIEQKGIKAELAELEPQIIEDMAEAGMQSANINNRTYYINRQLFAGAGSGFTKFDIIGALKASDLDDYVSETYNSQSLSAYVRSFAKENGNEDLSPEEIKNLLPEALRHVLYVGEQFRLGSRKG